MKKLLFVLTLFFSIPISFAQEEVSLAVVNDIYLNWEASFENALKRSKKEKKPVLIYFTGSDWCGPCITLDKNLFHTEKFKKMAEKDLILYMANVPNNKDLVTPEQKKVNDKLRRKYKQKSFPTLVMINHKGKMIGYKKGLILTEYYYPFFQSVIDNY